MAMIEVPEVAPKEEMGLFQRFQAQVLHVLVLAVSNGVPRRSLFISLIVGTTLTLINQGTVIFAGGFPTWWKVLLTYIVPYLVSSYGAVSAMLRSEKAASDTDENANANANASPQESIEAKVNVMIQDVVIQNMDWWQPPLVCQSSRGSWIKTGYMEQYGSA